MWQDRCHINALHPRVFRNECYHFKVLHAKHVLSRTIPFAMVLKTAGPATYHSCKGEHGPLVITVFVIGTSKTEEKFSAHSTSGESLPDFGLSFYAVPQG